MGRSVILAAIAELVLPRGAAPAEVSVPCERELDGSGGSAASPASGAAGADPGDAAMVEAARRGDRAAWGWLYRRYARLVHGVLVSRVAPQEAEDLVQDVFAKAMRRIGSVRDDACVGAWLAAVARNKATDFQRRRRRRQAASLDDAPEPSVKRGRSLDANEVLVAIRRLPEAYRETLVLRLVEGLTGPEIAQRLGMTHGSVRVNLHRGMAMLREALGLEDTP